MSLTKLPRPGCCKKAAEFNSRDEPNIYWWVDPEDNSKRGWQLSAYSGFVSHCPWCGTKLPAMQLKPKFPARVCTITDGGYYCDTCEKRLISCDCPLPGEQWEPVT